MNDMPVPGNIYYVHSIESLVDFATAFKLLKFLEEEGWPPVSLSCHVFCGIFLGTDEQGKMTFFDIDRETNKTVSSISILINLKEDEEDEV